MTSLRFTFCIVAVLVCFACGSLLCHAQNQRSWVASFGDDVNDCTRTAPCKTFPAAISQTVQNGEINIVDPGSYGNVTITKSITIDATGTFAGITAGGGTGIIINLNPALGNTDALHTVRLRGLSITGLFSNAKIGVRGINVASTNFTNLKVIVEDVVIDGFLNEGILYSVDGGDLVVKNSTIRNNDKAGIRVDSAGANIAHVRIDRTTTNLNQEGVRFEDNVRGTVTNSDASNNTLNGYVIFPTSLSSEMNIDSSTASHNKQYGIFSITNVGTSTIRISNMEITNNVVSGLANIAGGQICSNGKNRIIPTTLAPNCVLVEQ